SLPFIELGVASAFRNSYNALVKSALMYKYLFFLTFLFLSLMPVPGKAAPSQPFLDEIRTEINKQLALVPSTDRKLSARLKVALKTIDRPGTSNLGTDIKALNLLTASLGRTSLSETFFPLLEAAFDKYAEVLVDGSVSLGVRLNKLPASSFNTTARKSLDKYLELLAQIEASNDFAKAVKLLGKAATKFKVAGTLTAKAENPPLGPNTLTATVNGGAFKSSTLLLTGTYDPFTKGVLITGVSTTGLPFNPVVSQLTLTIFDVPEGTSTHSFVPDDQEAIGAYSTGGLGVTPRGAVAKQGTITLTLDLARKAVSGTFSFTGDGGGGAASINANVANGKFVVRFIQ
ncbi:MAG: hypothetical protein V4710_10695, partial [Verrucomicrobiota bacterium]